MILDCIDFRTHYKVIRSSLFAQMEKDIGKENMNYYELKSIICDECSNHYIQKLEEMEQTQSALSSIIDKIGTFTFKRVVKGQPQAPKDRMTQDPSNFVISISFFTQLKNLLRTRKRLLQNPHRCLPELFQNCCVQLDPTKNIRCVSLPLKRYH